MQQLYDVNGAAQLLAVSPWTVRAYIRDGKINPVRLGRLVRISQDELKRFIDTASNGDLSRQEAIGSGVTAPTV